MISPTVLKLQRMVSPSGTEYPHGSHGIPHVHHDILHGTEYPHGTGTQDIPHIYQDILHSTEYPHRTQDIPPLASWYPPQYCTHVIQGVNHRLESALN